MFGHDITIYADTKHAHTLFCSLGIFFHYSEILCRYWMCLCWRILWELYCTRIKCQIIKFFVRITCIIVLMLNTSIVKLCLSENVVQTHLIFDTKLVWISESAVFSQPHLFCFFFFFSQCCCSCCLLVYYHFLFFYFAQLGNNGIL